MGHQQGYTHAPNAAQAARSMQELQLGSPTGPRFVPPTTDIHPFTPFSSARSVHTTFSAQPQV